MILDGVTIAKTRFLVTKSEPFSCGRTARHGRTHTHRFLEPLYTISPSGNKELHVPGRRFLPLCPCPTMAETLEITHDDSKQQNSCFTRTSAYRNRRPATEMNKRRTRLMTERFGGNILTLRPISHTGTNYRQPMDNTSV